MKRKITLRSGTSKRELANYIILLPCLFQCLKQQQKRPWHQCLKCSTCPKCFYSGCSQAGLSSTAAQPDLSLSQLPTEQDVYTGEIKYYRPSATPYSTGLTKQIKALLLSGNLLTDYPFNMQWLIYLSFIVIISLTFPRWVPAALLPWELCRWMQEITALSLLQDQQVSAWSHELCIQYWHIVSFWGKSSFFLVFAQDLDYRN